MSFTTITVTWNAAGNASGTQYRLERSFDGTSYVPRTVVDALTYVDGGLTELTTYYYRVRAVNGDGILTIPSSAVVAVTPKKVDFMAPDEPMGLKGILDPTGKAFTLLWEPVTRNDDGTTINDLAGYNIYRRTTLTGTGNKITLEPLTVTAFADQVDGRTYYYNVRAIDSSGNESKESLFADSSRQANIIFLGADNLTTVTVPQSVNDVLRSMHNKYGVPLLITMTEKPIPSETNILRSINLSLIRGDNKTAVKDVAFSLPDTIVAVAYNVVNGQLARGVPTAQSADASAVTAASPKDLSFYWFNGVTWVKIGGTLDEPTQTLKTKTSFLGDYQLRIAPLATSLTLSEGNVYPRVFTPNGDGFNDRVYFVLENPGNAQVSGEILDLEGRLVANLPPPSTQSGVGTTLIWNGLDLNGAVAPGGVYLYRIKGEGKTFTGTVAVAR